MLNKDIFDKNTLAQQAPVTQATLSHHVFVCTGTACGANGSQATLEAFWRVLAQKSLLYGKRGSPSGQVLVTTCGSVGLCAVGPAVLIYPEGIWYAGVQPEDVEELVEAHFIRQQPLERLLAKTWAGR